MTQEEKAKAYDDALERAKRIKDGKGNWRFSDLSEIVPAVTEIFPVLAESEDERIRKFLVNEVLGHIGMLDIEGDRVVNNTRNELWKKALAYLEKQKEQKPAEWSEEDGIFLEDALWCVLATKYFVPKYVCDSDTRTSAEKWLKSLPKRLRSLRSRPKSSDNLPKWKKASAGTKLPSESVIRAEGQDPRFGQVAMYDCEYITVNDIEKLPKED